MLELAFNIATVAGVFLGWWFLCACAFYALFVYPILRVAREPEPAPKPVLVWVNERIEE